MAKKLENHLKEKGCYFISVTHKNDLRESMKEKIKEFPFWGWVDHLPDKETDEFDKHFHTHFILRTAGSRSVNQVAQILGISGQFVQVCRNKRSQMRYFRHLDNPEKIQYLANDIHTNHPSTFQIAWTDNQDDDVRRLFADLDKLRNGQITRSEFVDLHYLEFQKMPFYQKIKAFETITKAQGLPDVPARGAPC